MATWKKVLSSPSTADITVPDDTGTVALTGTATTQSFTGTVATDRLQVTGPANAVYIDNTNGGEIIWEGATSDEFETQLRAVDPTADNTITLPDDEGTVALTGTTTLQEFAGSVLAPTLIAGGAGLENSIMLNSLDGCITFEGDNEDAHETKVNAAEPTSDHLITFPDDGGTVALAENVLDLSGGTMSGNIDMDGGIIHSLDNLKFDERANMTTSLMPDSAVIYVNTSSKPMFKTVEDGSGAGSKMMLNLEDDGAPSLGGNLNLNGRNITGVQDQTLGNEFETVSDKTFKILCTNTSSGDGIIHIQANKLNIDGALSSAGGSSLVKNEDDMDADSDVHLATQQSIKAYVDNNNLHYINSGFNHNESGGTKVYIPVFGSNIEVVESLAEHNSEKLCWLAPSDGEMLLVQVRASSGGATVIVGLHTASDGDAYPSATPDCSVTEECPTADTTYDFDFSGEVNNNFSKGDVLMFSIEPENDINDTVLKITLRLDN